MGFQKKLAERDTIINDLDKQRAGLTALLAAVVMKHGPVTLTEDERNAVDERWMVTPEFAEDGSLKLTAGIRPDDNTARRVATNIIRAGSTLFDKRNQKT
jgi:hypothetical protein